MKMDADKPGRYFLFLSPDERVAVDRYSKTGFEPLKIILSDWGISKMQSGKVWQIKITEGKKKTIYVIDSDPLGAMVHIDGHAKEKLLYQYSCWGTSHCNAKRILSRHFI